jgi:uncharacterized membrane protein YhaH (DUF805 family)
VSGRARRREYGLFLVLNCLIALVGSVAIELVFAGLGPQGSAHEDLSVVVQLAWTAITIPVTVRRFHDLGHSGWFLLVLILPLVNIVFSLLLFFQDGQDGDNEYGPSPKFSPVLTTRWMA